MRLSVIPADPTRRGAVLRFPRRIRSVAAGPRAMLFGLAIAAVAIEGALAWLTALMLLPRYFPADNPGLMQQSLDFAMMLGNDWLRNIAVQAAAFTLMFAGYLAALWLLYRAPPRRATTALVLLAPLVWMATAALMYPPYARDLFHNLADARLLWLYHLNPMVTAPTARPFPINTSFANQPSAYGPVWYLLSFPGAVFQPANFLNSIVLLKLWMGAIYLASGVIIYLIVRAERPHLGILAAAVYLWNPFVIVRDLGDAHNDVVMIFFLLVALYLARRRLWLGVLPALALSVLVKWASLITAPLLVVYVFHLPAGERRHALPALLAGGAIAIGIALMLLIPFWAGPRTFDALRAEADKTATSTPHILEYFVTGSADPTPFAPTSRAIMRVLFLLPYGWLLLRLRPPQWRLHAGIFQAFLLYLLIAVAWFRPWYVLWVVTAGALLPFGWFLALTVTLSWFGMFPEIVHAYAGNVPWLGSSDVRLMFATILATFLVPALVWLAAFVQTRSWFLRPEPHLPAETGEPTI